MEWLALAGFGAAALAGAALVYVLTANIERGPEQPALVVDGMRLVGLVIALSGTVLGVVLFWTAVRAFVG